MSEARSNGETRGPAEQAVAATLERFKVAVVLGECRMGDCAFDVLETLRSLPIEQRMEAMGMEQYDDSCRNDGYGGHWHPKIEAEVVDA